MILTTNNYKVLFIFAAILALCLGAIADNSNTKRNRNFESNILALPANLDLTSELSTGTLEATMIRAKSENYSGLAIPVSLSSLISSPESKRLLISRLHEIVTIVRSRYLMPYIVIDCRIDSKLVSDENQEANIIIDSARHAQYQTELTTLGWGDGLSSPVTAYNEITDNEGIFIFDWKYGNRLWSLNNYSYLTDGNRNSRVSRWISKSGESPVDLELTFTKPFNVERVELFFEECYPTSAFDIQLQVTEHPQARGEWQECYKIDNNSNSHPVIEFDKPYYATAMRIQFYPEGDVEVVRLHEVEIYMQNMMGEVINLARDGAFLKKVSNFGPPEHVMLVVNNDRSVALVGNETLKNAGVMLLPWRWIVAFVGERYVELAKSIEMEIPVSWSTKKVKFSETNAPVFCTALPFPISIDKARTILADEISYLAKELKPEGILITHLETDPRLGGTINVNPNIEKRFLQNAKLYQDCLQQIKTELHKLPESEINVKLGVVLNAPLGFCKFEKRNWAMSKLIPEGAPVWFDESFASYGVGDIVDFICVNSKNTNRGLYLDGLIDNGCLSTEFVKLDLPTIRNLVVEQTLIYNFSWSK